MNLDEMGQRIKQQRETRKLRQSDLANTLQVSFQAVSKWERGENAPDITLLPKLARILGVSADWLLCGNETDMDTLEVTVFCTSLAGFAQRSGQTPPRELATWMNGLFHSITEVLVQHRGVPVKYVGDGFLGFFSGPDHTRRAVQAATAAMRTLDRADLVISIHNGDVYLGPLGHSDFARPDILGEPVNTAFMLLPWIEAHCTSHIGITEAAKNNLRLPLKLEPCGTTSVKNVSNINIYEPTG